MTFLYDVVVALFGICYLPAAFFKKKLSFATFSERSGSLACALPQSPVWIHAVSVGETMLGVRLASAIKAARKEVRILVSNTTETGHAVTKAKAKGAVDAVIYSPLDLSFVTRRFVERIRPSVYVIMETEIWPNIITCMAEKKVPVVVANGRISDRSFSGYKAFRPFVKRILRRVTLFCMQTEADARRITALGADPSKVMVTGNIKFDEDDTQSARKSYGNAYFKFGGEDMVVVAGSTHSPEESWVLNAFSDLRREHPSLRLILAPRHVNRARAVLEEAVSRGFKAVMFSELRDTGAVSGAYNDVVVVDTMGHLRNIYSAATVVFVGGSLVKHGGQNPIEPAGWGKPVVFGKYMFNFRAVAGLFLSCGAAAAAGTPDELRKVLGSLLGSAGKRDAMAAAAGVLIERNTGATGRVAEQIFKLLDQRK
jgi:3-deoxy-D-manno-octulosonic-acid transferase